MRKITVNENEEKSCLNDGTIYEKEGEYFMLFDVDGKWIFGCLNDGDTWSGIVSADEMLKDIESQKFTIVTKPITIGSVR